MITMRSNLSKDLATLDTVASELDVFGNVECHRWVDDHKRATGLCPQPGAVSC